MSASAFVAAVLALPNLDCLFECQDASGNPVDSSPGASDITTVSGTVNYQDPGPDGGSDFSIRLQGGSIQRSTPMNTLTDDMTIGMWVQHISSSTNLALIENGNPGPNGYGTLFDGSGKLRPLVHSVAFQNPGATDLSDGLWHLVGLQRDGGNWEQFKDGSPDANNPLGSSTPNTPTTKFIVNRNSADFRVAYIFSVSDALSDATWAALYAAMAGGAAPSNVTPPALSGAAVAGRNLTTDDGTWSDADSIAYQWESSPDGVSSWTPISGEVANTYLVVGGDIGNWLRCMVTATNGDGDTDEPSNVLGPALAAFSGPVEVAAFSGDHANGYSAANYTPDTSSVLAGDYMVVALEAIFTSGLGAIGLPDGWETLENDVVSGSGRVCLFGKLTYEDAPTEVFTFPSSASFVGTLTVVRGGYNAETPISDYGKTTNNTLSTVSYDTNDLVLGITLGSDPTNPGDVSVIPAGFTNVIEEKVSVASVIGWVVDSTKLEAAGAGSTSGLSFTYATGSDYSTSTLLFEFDPGIVPVIVDDPVVSGIVRVAETLSCTEGTWTETPTSFSYDWERSADGSTGWADVGADADTYTIDIADEGYYFRCKVTASNVSGAGTPESSNVVGPADPYPTITRFTVSG